MLDKKRSEIADKIRNVASTIDALETQFRSCTDPEGKINTEIEKLKKEYKDLIEKFGGERSAKFNGVI